MPRTFGRIQARQPLPPPRAADKKPVGRLARADSGGIPATSTQRQKRSRYKRTLPWRGHDGSKGGVNAFREGEGGLPGYRVGEGGLPGCRVGDAGSAGSSERTRPIKHARCSNQRITACGLVVASYAVVSILADPVDAKKCETVSQPSIQPDTEGRPMGR